MNVKRTLLILGLIVVGQLAQGYSYWFNNATDGDIRVEGRFPLVLGCGDLKQLDIPSGEYGHFDSGHCCLSEIQITKTSGSGQYKTTGWISPLGKTGLTGEACGSVGHKIADSDVATVPFLITKDFIQRNRNVWRIVNKTGYKMGFNIITSQGCSVVENYEGDYSCDILGSIKGIVFNGDSPVENPYKVLPWNGKIRSDAVFFVRKMTDTEKKVLATGYKDPGAVDERFENISGVFQWTPYREAEYIIELHRKGS